MEIFELTVVRFLIVGGLVYGLAMALLVLLVERIHMTKPRASLVVLVLSLQVSFLLNHYWTFASVPAENFIELAGRWVAYCGARAVPLAFEQAGFVFLVRRRVPYLLASLIVVAVGFAFVYIASAAIIFVER